MSLLIDSYNKVKIKKYERIHLLHYTDARKYGIRNTKRILKRSLMKINIERFNTSISWISFVKDYFEKLLTLLYAVYM